ncbi:hypothetical protein [Vaginella massiliensis]|uniref:hypothetical protein n=1 Tax=Vaginella massiliensis TaxID=1816680 RepID=UPI000837FBF8|nr:hypothetical protein [Vaginella massiliensis]
MLVWYVLSNIAVSCEKKVNEKVEVVAEDTSTSENNAEPEENAIVVEDQSAEEVAPATASVVSKTVGDWVLNVQECKVVGEMLTVEFSFSKSNSYAQSPSSIDTKDIH